MVHVSEELTTLLIISQGNSGFPGKKGVEGEMVRHFVLLLSVLNVKQIYADSSCIYPFKHRVQLVLKASKETLEDLDMW